MTPQQGGPLFSLRASGTLGGHRRRPRRVILVPEVITMPLVSPAVIHTFSREALGLPLHVLLSALSNSAVQAANRALFIPFTVEADFTIYAFEHLNGVTISGNFDTGIYDDTLARLISLGPTAQVGASVLQRTAIAPLALAPGKRYWLAFAFDNATATTIAAGINANRASILAIAMQLAAFPLPATATFAVPTGILNIPIVSISGHPNV